jgi:oxygen-independent coproporphyrinogen-3 oxidase
MQKTLRAKGIEGAVSASLVARQAVPVPRYTSYPTANHFNASVDDACYRDWLGQITATTPLSLYLHIPYCRELCWYCGCSTKATHQYEPVVSYLDSLEAEIGAVAALLPAPRRVTHVHWGGGSPNILEAEEILRLGASLRRHFDLAQGAEYAVEIDPRLMKREQAAAFAEIGVNRVSVGLQDFEEKVQHAIGRLQSYAQTRETVDLFREQGIDSINIDLVYGLPHQTEESAARTLHQVLTLNPDRIAIFGYAHLPARLKHQRLIDEKALPDGLQRYAQSRRLATMLVDAGFRQIGLDHFARADDKLATQPLNRNFQGYTTDGAQALIGLGSSAISRLPQGYAQNAVAAEEYARRVADGKLATARGWTLTQDDRIRAAAIERLMCDFTFSAADLMARFGRAAVDVMDAAADIVADDRDGLVEPSGDGFVLTERGRPFVRNICARFDAYLPREIEQRRHALAV